MAPTARSKKVREQGFLQAFLHIEGLPAKILDAGRESPDFLLEIEGRRVGLEVTEVFVGEHPRASTKAAESIVDEIIERAKRAYEGRGGKLLQVTLRFASRADMRNVNRIKAADAIANFLFEADPQAGGAWGYDRRATGFDRLPEQLVSITAYFEPSYSTSHWWTPSVGWVSPLDTNALQPSVDDKARKIARYRQEVAECWLLLAIEGRSASQMFEPSDTPPAVASPFDRTYLLFLFSSTVQLLPSVTD